MYDGCMAEIILFIIFSTFVLLPFLALFGLIVWFFFKSLGEVKRLSESTVAFGMRHGLLIPSTHLTYRGLLAGSLGAQVRGVDSQTGRTVELFHLPCVEQSSRNRRSYRRTVLSLSIKPTGQHIFVNSRLNDVTEQMPHGEYERYQAEGQFSKYFDIYTPKGKQIEALSLFAPDLMAYMMAEFGRYDIEIVDDVVYIYEYSDLKEDAKLEDLYTLANGLAKEIDSNAPRKPILKKADGAPSESAVTSMRSGYSAKDFIVSFGAIAAFQVSGYIGRLLFPDLAPVFTLVAGGLALGVFVYSVFRNKRLSKQYELDRQQFLEGIKQSS